jgi:heavy metal sensor kinase
MADARPPRLAMRARLTLWYASALALFAAALAISGYTLVARVTLTAVDDALTQVVTSVGDALELESREHKLDGVSIPLVLREFRFPDMTVTVLDPRGDTLYQSTDVIEGEEQAADSVRVLAQRANPNGDALEDWLTDSTTRRIRHGTIVRPNHLRLATLERMEGKRPFRIGALRTLTTRDRVLSRLRIALLAATPLLIIFAALGGNILARGGLHPISVMAERAHRISAATLHERLPIGRTDDEPGRLALAFNALLGRLDESFDQQRQFVADASHELRTPVAIVSGEAQLALSRDDRSPAELRAALQTIRREADRLQHIVSDLFLLARADAREPMLSLVPVYLGELAEESVQSMGTLASSKQIALSYTGPVDLPVRGDEQLLRRLVMNLIDNAIKYTPAGGRVSVTGSTVGTAHQLRVCDTGIGIPPKDQPKIFERFYRVNGGSAAGALPPATPNVSSGAGLGLAIAHWIAEAHGGQLSLESSAAEGTTFLLSLPASD